MVATFSRPLHLSDQNRCSCLSTREEKVNQTKKESMANVDKRESFTETNGNVNAVQSDIIHNDQVVPETANNHENEALISDIKRRSLPSGLHDDGDDIMTETVTTSGKQNNDGKGTVNADKRSAEAEEAVDQHPEIPQTEASASYLDMSIGNDIPIAMERRSDLTADATSPEEMFDDSSSANIMIQNHESPVSFERMNTFTADATKPLDVIKPVNAVNLMQENENPVALERESDLDATASSPKIIESVKDPSQSSISREKRDSIRSDNPFFESIVSPDVASLTRNKNGNDKFEALDFDASDDLMKAMVGETVEDASPIHSHQEIKQQIAPAALEQVSTLTARASPLITEIEHKGSVETKKNELKTMKTTASKAEKKQQTSHTKERKSHHKDKGKSKQSKKGITTHTHNKHTQGEKKGKLEHPPKLPPVSNHRKNELTAKATSPKDTRSRSKNSKRSKIEGTQGELKSIFTEMRTAKRKLTRNDIRKLAKTAVMLAALKSNDGLDEVLKSEKRQHIAKPKTKSKKKKVTKKESSEKKKTKKSKTRVAKVDASEEISKSDAGSPEMSFNTKDLSNQPEFTLNHNLDKEEVAKKEKLQRPQLDITVEQPVHNEFSEDTTKKSRNVGMSDEAMRNIASKSSSTSEDELAKQTTTTAATTSRPVQPSITEAISETETTTVTPTTIASLQNILATTPMPTTEGSAPAVDFSKGSAAAVDFSKELAMKVIAEGNIISKKSEVTHPDDDIEKAISDYDTNDLLAMIDNNNSANKKNVVPTKEVSDSMTTLKSVLSKVSPNKVPGNFLPDIPAGLRMIAWKKLLEKKRSQLAEYESAVAVSEAAAVSDSSKADDTYTKLGGDDKESFAKKSPADQTEGIKDLENDEGVSFMTVGTHDDNMETARHVHYLKKHISGARSLRKLIAKTLVGHCKSTGKRILSAFIAMDKALERAQAIATVIGGKFNVDPSKIENLVSDKEDQVVETFLRDIFTKL